MRRRQAGPQRRKIALQRRGQARIRPLDHRQEMGGRRLDPGKQRGRIAGVDLRQAARRRRQPRQQRPRRGRERPHRLGIGGGRSGEIGRGAGQGLVKRLSLRRRQRLDRRQIQQGGADGGAILGSGASVGIVFGIFGLCAAGAFILWATSTRETARMRLDAI